MRLLIPAVAALALFAGQASACNYTSAAVYAAPAQVQFAPAPVCAPCVQQAMPVQAAPAVVQQAPVYQQQAVQLAPSFTPSYSYGVQQSFAPSFAPSYGYSMGVQRSFAVAPSYGVQASAVIRQRAFTAPAVGYAPAVVAAPVFAAPVVQRSVTVERHGLLGRRSVTRSATVIGP